MAKFPFFHSYIGIQPAKTGQKLKHEDHSTGIHHIAIWVRSKKDVDKFHEDFLLNIAQHHMVPYTNKANRQ